MSLRRLRPRLAVLTAVPAGLALYLAFPPTGAWPLAPVGVALLLVSVSESRAKGAFARGLLFGMALYAPLLSWLINLGWLPWVALVAVQSVFAGAFCVAVRALMRMRCWPLVVPAAWVGFEAAFSRFPLGGFPWARLAFTQVDAPTLPWVAVGGVPMLSFVVALVGSALAWAVLARRRGPIGTLAAAVCLAAAAPLLPHAAPAPTGRQITVAAVQGNVPRMRTLADQLRVRQVTANHAAATHELARAIRSGTTPRPDVVIWPENSTDTDPASEPDVYALISGAVDDIDRPVLVGALPDAPGGGAYNAGQLWLPGRGPTASYAKRQLVPFGEYVPFRPLLGWVSQLQLVQRDFRPGTRPGVLHAGSVRLGDVICYEVAFDDVVRSTVRSGADVLVVQTNNATYMRDGQNGETLQQLAMARVRAVEHNRSTVVASTVGVSAIIAPDGSLISKTGTWRRAAITASVPTGGATTLATRIGDWPELLLTLAAAAALGWALTGSLWRQRKRTGEAAAPTDTADEAVRAGSHS